VRYRNEIKHIITPADRAAVCASLRTVADTDSHAGTDGTYRVRSLYFDNIYDKTLREKTDGLKDREKFRIRYYDEDLGFIRLEKKVKRGNVGYKVSAKLTEDEVRRIIAGDTRWMASCGRGLIMELYCRMQTQLLRPKVIVDYRRAAFVYAPGNVRVTVDDDIRAGQAVEAFFDGSCVTLPVVGDTVLEVKWDEFLPNVIRSAVQLNGRRQTAFSKYAACRIYG